MQPSFAQKAVTEITPQPLEENSLPVEETSLPFPAAGSSLTVLPLNNEHEAEVLAFLAERPLHTFFMAGAICDNGLVSELHRGLFYACRNRKGEIEGVALIGHTTLVEARSEAALSAFACFTRYIPSAYMILGEQEKVERFWNYFARPNQSPYRTSRELLMHQQEVSKKVEPLRGLRPATLEDLPVLLSVYAWMAFEESGNNPLETDPEGFQQRWSNRIEKGRVWVWIENERLIFNACTMAETADCAYLGGIYVNPEERGKGYGLRCLSQLRRNLRFVAESTARPRSLCVLVGEPEAGAQAFFEKAGYKPVGYYDTLFLCRKT